MPEFKRYKYKITYHGLHHEDVEATSREEAIKWFRERLSARLENEPACETWDERFKVDVEESDNKHPDVERAFNQ
jgi:hypothetical protein